MNSKIKCDEKRGVGLFVRRLPLLTAMVSATALVTGCLSSNSPNDTIQGVVSDFKVNYMAGAPDVVWGAPVVLKAFRPGQASYEYLDSSDHTGDMKSTCSSCHDSTISTPPHVGAIYDEDDPVPSVEIVNITVQAAYDVTNFYLKASWNSVRPGITHGIRRNVGGVWGVWDDEEGEWANSSTAREPGTVLEEGEVFAGEDRFGVMFMPLSEDISTGASFHQAGCFVTCHADMDDMPEWNEDEDEVTKYLVSGSPDGALTSFATFSESNADVSAGSTKGFPDMWHWRGGRSAAVQGLTDGYVMDTRASDAGLHTYANNFGNLKDADASDLPVWVYDPAWMEGYIALHFSDYTGKRDVSTFPAALWDAALQNAPPLITAGGSLNAVLYASAGTLEENGIIPHRRISPQGGSRNDVMAYSNWENGVWTLVMKRARNTTNNDDHVINPADGYTFGFAVFQDHTQHRWHNVTFPVTLGIEGSSAKIRAKQN